MEEPMSDAEVRERAEKKVKEKVRLLSSAGLWVVFSVFFFLIWLLTGRGYPWFWWPIAGLGFALFIQVVGYFSGKRGIATNERMVEKEMERIRKDG